jgi:acetylornithine/succinyldiaminopimelate/putrescine aminotransferase
MLIAEQTPNFFRLYLNPYVAQACVCLETIVRQSWPTSDTQEERRPTYLGNALEEVLSGACKLARYETECRGKSQRGLIIDPAARLKYFEGISVASGEQITLIPETVVLAGPEAIANSRNLSGEEFGFVVVLPEAIAALQESDLRDILKWHARLRIVCLDRDTWLRSREPNADWPFDLDPDVVVFDESFVNRDVPFSAFTSRSEIYGRWMQPGTSTFHSTTFQPNSISTLHLVRSLTAAAPEFMAVLRSQLSRLESDLEFRSETFAELFSPSLAKAIRTINFNQRGVEASGHYVKIGNKSYFDGVAGVACSIRGHNPPTYVDELEEADSEDNPREFVAQQLHELSGLPHHLPAVTGGGAVEAALKLGLTAQFPKKYVLAFHGGFGGKTLLALTGTANPKYKTRLGDLYPHVIYVDPFADDVCETVDRLLSEYPVALVQLELVQGVGGVISLPDRLLEHLQKRREEHDLLMFVDEVQTGMFRTGPFLHCRDRGVTPDLVSMGKATSDMMFPFAFTLFNDKVLERVERQQPDLIPLIRPQYDYDLGYRTVANTLRRAGENDLEDQIRRAGKRFAEQLHAALDGCSAVKEVRVFGLLIAIELSTEGGLRAKLQKMLFRLYFAALLRDRRFPMIIGFCQYKPNILKFTPPLSTTPEESDQLVGTLKRVMHTPLPLLVVKAAGLIVRSKLRG